MLRKRKESKAKKSIAETLMRDAQGLAAEKLRMFEMVRAAGGFAKEDPVEHLIHRSPSPRGEVARVVFDAAGERRILH